MDYRFYEADKSRFVDKMRNLTDEQKNRLKSALKYDPSLENYLYQAYGDWQKSANWKWSDLEGWVTVAEDTHAKSVEKQKRDGRVKLEPEVDYHIVYREGDITIYEVKTYACACVLASNAVEPKLEMDIPDWAWDHEDVNEWCMEANEEDKMTASGAHWCIAMRNTREHWEEYVDNDGIHPYIAVNRGAEEDDEFGKVCFFISEVGELEVWDATDYHLEVDECGEWAPYIERLEPDMKPSGNPEAFGVVFPEDKGKEDGYLTCMSEARKYGVEVKFEHHPIKRGRKTNEYFITVSLSHGMNKELRNSVRTLLYQGWLFTDGKDGLIIGGGCTEAMFRRLRNKLEKMLEYLMTENEGGREYSEENLKYVDSIVEEFFGSRLNHPTPSEGLAVTELSYDGYLLGDLDVGFNGYVKRNSDDSLEVYFLIKGDFPYFDDMIVDIVDDLRFKDAVDIYGDANDDWIGVVVDNPLDISDYCDDIVTILKYIAEVESNK